jgi:hypothetical protein
MKNEALISAHPIAPAMRAQILDCLRQTAHKREAGDTKC